MNSGDENFVDLDLQAFRYVGNDMTDDELQQFEERLAEDQPTREAVARAVQIGQAVVFFRPVVSQDTLPTSSGRRLQRRRKRLVIVVASVAVAFLAGIGISHWFDRSSSQGLPIASSGIERSSVGNVAVTALNGSAGYVLALWSESASEFGQYAEELPNDSEASQNGGEQPGIALAASGSWVSNDEDAEFDLPGWMLAAVSPDEEPDTPHPDSMPEEN